jgi:ABC-type transport system involved in multi-copper enzyme maturation permease subunit
MTALTAPAAPPAARRRPVPWTRLAWVTWRQHRAGLAGTAVLLGGLSVYLLVTGLQIRSAYGSVTSCHPAGSVSCEHLAFAFQLQYQITPRIVSALILLMPLLIGAFVGAPLLARELETGTFRYAWTQGCGRLRWAITKLALLAAALTAAAGAFSVLFSWYIHPFIADGQISALKPLLFGLRGVAFAASTLAAFAISAFAGTTIRRTVPALAASLTAVTGLDLATAFLLRQYYQAPLTAHGSAPAIPPGSLGASSWLLRSWTTGPDGQAVSQATINGVINPAQSRFENAANPNAFMAWLSQHHFTQWWAYQPQSRFWHFQLTEGSWLLALSLILITATLWLVRHRAT